MTDSEDGRPAAPRRRRLSPVTRVVLAVDALGLAAIALVVAGRLPAHSGDLPWWGIPALVALTCAGELIYVRVRHGGSTEDLTLFEAAVVIDVLLLPPSAAVVVPVVALAIASLILRRPRIKAAFNLGTYAVATAVFVAGLPIRTFGS